MKKVTPETRLISKSLEGLIIASKTKNTVLMKLLGLAQKPNGKEHTRNIAFRKKTLALSFCPAGKPTIMSQEKDKRWVREGRQEGKVGRVLRRVFKEQCPEFEFTDSEIEQAVNIIKGIAVDGEFKIVSGKDIKKWYTNKKYNAKSSSLSQSCMNNQPSYRYEMYVDNDKEIQMLLLIGEDGKLLGRALIWEGKWMDRIYADNDAVAKSFKNYAIDNGLYARDGNSQSFTAPDGKQGTHKVSIKLSKVDYAEFPYRDTFTRVDRVKKTMSNF